VNPLTNSAVNTGIPVPKGRDKFVLHLTVVVVDSSDVHL